MLAQKWPGPSIYLTWQPAVGADAYSVTIGLLSDLEPNRLRAPSFRTCNYAAAISCRAALASGSSGVSSRNRRRCSFALSTSVDM